MSKKKLFPIAMIRPSKESVYGLSKIRKPITTRGHKPAGKILVSFDKDGISNPKMTQTYNIRNGNPMLGRYVEKSS